VELNQTDYDRAVRRLAAMMFESSWDTAYTAGFLAAIEEVCGPKEREAIRKDAWQRNQVLRTMQPGSPPVVEEQ
jgi:hypothetical protein